MNNERPFENIIPVPNIKVGYFEKEEYLKIIDRQEKQIQALGDQIIALQARNDILEKSKKPQGKRAEGALLIIDRLYIEGHISNTEQGIMRRAILLPEKGGAE